MQVTNKTVSKVQHLVKFVAQHSEFAAVSRLILNQSLDTAMRGLATMDGLDLYVEIWLPVTRAYPVISHHLDKLKPETLYSWEEEFVLVLAHELRHIEQFYTGSYFQMTSLQAEYDAESVGLGVLDRFRVKEVLKRAA